LEIADSTGTVVRRWASDQAPERPRAGQYFADAWLPRLAPLPARAGHNRFVWDLREPRPRTDDDDFSIAAVPEVGTPVVPQGLLVPPGTYEVRLTVDDRTLTQPLTVVTDPRVRVTASELAQQRALYRELAETLAALAAVKAEVADEVSRPDARRSELDPLTAELAAVAGVLAGLATDVESVDRAPTAAQREVLASCKERFEAARSRWQGRAKGVVGD
jgi:hypothetical protein